MKTSEQDHYIFLKRYFLLLSEVSVVFNILYLNANTNSPNRHFSHEQFVNFTCLISLTIIHNRIPHITIFIGTPII